MIPFVAVVVSREGKPRAVGRNAKEAWTDFRRDKIMGSSLRAVIKRAHELGFYIQRFAAPDAADTE